MKVIIAGSREGFDAEDIRIGMELYIEEMGGKVTEVVSGAARGVDKLGEGWARANGIPIEQFSALWDKQGKSAGYIRNAAMADYADVLVAFWDGKSKGTKHMIDLAQKKGLQVIKFGYQEKE